MNNKAKYCFYCGIELNREVKYCPGCGTHIEEEPSYEIKDVGSKEESSSTAQTKNPDSVQDKSSSVNSSITEGVGLAVGAALLVGHRHRTRIHRRMQRHRRKIRRARIKQRRMLRNARMMRKRI